MLRADLGIVGNLDIRPRAANRCRQLSQPHDFARLLSVVQDDKQRCWLSEHHLIRFRRRLLDAHPGRFQHRVGRLRIVSGPLIDRQFHHGQTHVGVLALRVGPGLPVTPLPRVDYCPVSFGNRKRLDACLVWRRRRVVALLGRIAVATLTPVAKNGHAVFSNAWFVCDGNAVKDWST